MKTHRRKASKKDWRRNPLIRAFFRAMQRCEYCGRPCPDGCDPHHWPKKRAGGGHGFDSRLTLIGLCRGWWGGKWVSCHDDAEAWRIDPSEIEAIICAREGCLQHERTAAVECMLTLPANPHAARAAAGVLMPGLSEAVYWLVERVLKESRV